MQYKNYTKRTYTKKAKKTRSPAIVTPATLKSYVKASMRGVVRKAIRATTENKVTDPLVQSNAPIIPMTALGFGTFIVLSDIFLTGQGPEQGNRIGNSITPVKWTMKGALFCAPTSTIPMLVRVYIFKMVDGYQLPSTGGAVPSDFFQSGSFTSAPNNTISDNFKAINKDKYKVYKSEVFKVGVSSTANYQNNDFKILNTFNYNLLKYQNHKFKFNDANTIPQNAGLYMAFTCCDMDDTPIQPNALRIAYEINGEYEDA